jgi:hypothetical protein
VEKMYKRDDEVRQEGDVREIEKEKKTKGPVSAIAYQPTPLSKQIPETLTDN